MPADIADGETGLSARTKINSSFGNSAEVDYPNGITLSGGSDVLDTYEEGTWTPGIEDDSGNSGSISGSNALYTRIGRVVHVSALITNLNTAGMTAGDDIRITGLPFTINASNRAVGSVVMDTVTFTGNYVCIRGLAGTNYMTLRDVTTAGADVNLLVSNISSGTSDLFISLTYFV